MGAAALSLFTAFLFFRPSRLFLSCFRLAPGALGFGGLFSFGSLLRSTPKNIPTHDNLSPLQNHDFETAIIWSDCKCSSFTAFCLFSHKPGLFSQISINNAQQTCQCDEIAQSGPCPGCDPCNANDNGSPFEVSPDCIFRLFYSFPIHNCSHSISTENELGGGSPSKLPRLKDAARCNESHVDDQHMLLTPANGTHALVPFNYNQPSQARGFITHVPLCCPRYCQQQQQQQPVDRQDARWATTEQTPATLVSHPLDSRKETDREHAASLARIYDIRVAAPAPAAPGQNRYQGERSRDHGPVKYGIVCLSKGNGCWSIYILQAVQARGGGRTSMLLHLPPCALCNIIKKYLPLQLSMIYSLRTEALPHLDESAASGPCGGAQYDNSEELEQKDLPCLPSLRLDDPLSTGMQADWRNEPFAAKPVPGPLHNTPAFRRTQTQKSNNSVRNGLLVRRTGLLVYLNIATLYQRLATHRQRRSGWVDSRLARKGNSRGHTQRRLYSIPSTSIKQKQKHQHDSGYCSMVLADKKPAPTEEHAYWGPPLGSINLSPNRQLHRGLGKNTTHPLMPSLIVPPITVLNNYLDVVHRGRGSASWTPDKAEKDPKRRRLTLRTLNVSAYLQWMHIKKNPPSPYSTSRPGFQRERGDPSRDTFSMTVCGLAEALQKEEETQRQSSSTSIRRTEYCCCSPLHITLASKKEAARLCLHTYRKSCRDSEDHFPGSCKSQASSRFPEGIIPKETQYLTRGDEHIHRGDKNPPRELNNGLSMRIQQSGVCLHLEGGRVTLLLPRTKQMKPTRRNFVSPVPSMRTDINSVPPNSLYTISAGLAFKAAHSTLSYIEENASSSPNPGIVAPQRSKARLLQEVNPKEPESVYSAGGPLRTLSLTPPPSYLRRKGMGQNGSIRMEDAAYALRGCRTRDHLVTSTSTTISPVPASFHSPPADISLRIHPALYDDRLRWNASGQNSSHTQGQRLVICSEPDGVILPPSNLPPSPYQPFSVICRPVRPVRSGSFDLSHCRPRYSQDIASSTFTCLPVLPICPASNWLGLSEEAKNSDGLHPYPVCHPYLSFFYHRFWFSFGNQRQSWEESLDCQKIPSQRPYMSPITAAAGATINDSMLRTWRLATRMCVSEATRQQQVSNPQRRPRANETGRTARAERPTSSAPAAVLLSQSREDDEEEGNRNNYDRKPQSKKGVVIPSPCTSAVAQPVPVP
ncbi:hypothetical protein CCUS01_03711 [Colletotrichum cuscutae]|uniref:Uncharacterized protein n=1 Tax=Colletotrichum cuscutae TaxID=1209917 RepID=A0AAI9VE94_9PEZI|nr:hypothetical protein CCUS01_03711 [Colletotrichum cuscutae]